MRLLIKKNVDAYTTYKSTPYTKELNRLAGQWVTVEMEYLFQDQFNIEESDIRVYTESLDKIDLEGLTFEEFKTVFKENYDKRYPDTKLTYHDTFFSYLYFLVTGKEQKRACGYNIYGNEYNKEVTACYTK